MFRTMNMTDEYKSIDCSIEPANAKHCFQIDLANSCHQD